MLDNSGQTYSLALAKRINARDGKSVLFWLSLDGGATGRCGIYTSGPQCAGHIPQLCTDLTL